MVLLIGGVTLGLYALTGVGIVHHCGSCGFQTHTVDFPEQRTVLKGT